jgi:RecB family exonuclease
LRFTVTELSAYLHCPRCYELRYVRGLAPHSPPASPVACGRLRPTERGTVVHRALQRLGRGPVEGLRALVEAALRESGLAGHDRDEVESIVELLQAFTESETWRLVSRAAELRTEASVVAPFEGGLLEGQIDALLTDREGGLHVLDYKTGRAQEEGTRGQHLFQVGAYAAALERCRGCLPASVAVHYLAGNERIEADPAEAASPARRQAEEAMCGIRDARFPRSPSCDPQTCAYAWVCGTEEWAIHRAARATPP